MLHLISKFNKNFMNRIQNNHKILFTYLKKGDIRRYTIIKGGLNTVLYYMNSETISEYIETSLNSVSLCCALF